jgi:hypothetical protein
LQSGQVLLPRYAAYADQDIFIGRFSALVGVPRENRSPLPGTHTGFIKVKESTEDAVVWLNDRIGQVGETRAQARREIRFGGQTSAVRKQTAIRAQLWGSDAAEWDNAYLDACDRLSVRVITSKDARDLDLLVNVCRSSYVLANDVRREEVKHRTLKAHAKSYHADSPLVGTSTLGEGCFEAAEVVREWVGRGSAYPPYVEPSPAPPDLADNIESWLRLAVRLQARTRSAGQATSDELLAETSGLRRGEPWN